jgi:hypothetical protein
MFLRHRAAMKNQQSERMTLVSATAALDRFTESPGGGFSEGGHPGHDMSDGLSITIHTASFCGLRIGGQNCCIQKNF